MKTKASTLVLGLFLVAAVRTYAAEARMVAAANEPPTVLSPGWYAGGGIRGNFMEDTSLKQLNGPTTGTVKFDPGAGFIARGGYRFCEWFALEGEFGFIGNSISSITGASTDAALYQVPLMANAVITIPTRTPLTPYAGFGLGGTSSIIDADHITVGGVTLFGSEATTTFSWQVFAGVEYEINNRLSVGATYNYRSVDGPKWDRAGFPIEFGDLSNHSIGVSATFHF